MEFIFVNIIMRMRIWKKCTNKCNPLLWGASRIP